MKRIIVIPILALFAFISAASAQTGAASSDAQKLLGTWKLVSYVGEEIPSGARADVMGPRPSGSIIYGPDGRMMVIIVGSDRRRPVGSKTITHHIEISWDQSRTGESHVRTYQWDGDRLTLTTHFFT